MFFFRWITKLFRHIYQINEDDNDCKIESWGSTGMLQENINNPHISDINFAPKLIGDYQFKKVEFKRICLKQENVFFLHKSIVKFIYFS